MAVDTSLADLLRSWRERALLTQEQLARRTGLGVRTVRRLEADGLRRPRTDSVRLLAEALALSADERQLLVVAARAAIPPTGTPPTGNPRAGTPPVEHLPADTVDASRRDEVDAPCPEEPGSSLDDEVALHRRAGDRHGEATALHALGVHHALLGDYERALAACQESLALCEVLGDARGAARAWDSIGSAYHHLGEYDLAVAGYRKSAEWSYGIGDRWEGGATLGRLGDTLLGAGDWHAARTAWQEALETLDELGHPDAVTVRARLTSLRRA